MTVFPMTRDDANAFVRQWHRHHKRVRVHRFAIGARIGLAVVGAVIVANPVGGFTDPSLVFEVVRLTCTGEHPNTATRLLAAARRSALAQGYRRGISYTRVDEPGTCYRAAGWWPTARVDGRGWNTGNKATRWLPGVYEATTEVIDRVRWETGPDADPELPDLAHLGRRRAEAA